MGQFDDVSKSVVIGRYKKLNAAHKKAERERDDLRKQNKRLREANKQILADNEDLSRLRGNEELNLSYIRQLEGQLEETRQELVSATLTQGKLRRDLELANEAAKAHRSALMSWRETVFEQWGVMEDQVTFAMQNMLEQAKLITDDGSTEKDYYNIEDEMPPLVPAREGEENHEDETSQIDASA